MSYNGPTVTDALPCAALVAHGALQPPLMALRVTFAALVREGDLRAAGGTLWAPAPAAPPAAERQVDKRLSFASVVAASVAYGRDFPTGRLGAHRMPLAASGVALSLHLLAAGFCGCHDCCTVWCANLATFCRSMQHSQLNAKHLIDVYTCVGALPPGKGKRRL